MESDHEVSDLGLIDSLAVCLSGGGHRAALFGLGALLYLVEAQANRNVTSIASVSGGSLTNAFVGQSVAFRKTTSSEFRSKVVTPLGIQIARRGTLFAPWLTKLYLTGIVALAFLTLGVATFSPWSTGSTAVVVIALVWLWFWLFGLRGSVCARAFSSTLFSPGGKVSPLSILARPGLDHVLCATELRSAQHVYFSGTFVYSFALGCGKAGGLTMARAVQASACFPGGFPPAYLPSKTHEFSRGDAQERTGHAPKELVLTDGGVYDNMADQWARGWSDRVRRNPSLGVDRRSPQQLIVVNGSARVPWRPIQRFRIPLLHEVAAFLRINDIMYVNTTNLRRQVIVNSFDPTMKAKPSDLPGLLIQIAQSPFVVAERYAQATGNVKDRADCVIALLGEHSKQAWEEKVKRNARVKTTLRAIGTDEAAELIQHGYVLAMCNLHVIFGNAFPLINKNFSVEDFRGLLTEGQAPSVADGVHASTSARY